MRMNNNEIPNTPHNINLEIDNNSPKRTPSLDVILPIPEKSMKNKSNYMKAHLHEKWSSMNLSMLNIKHTGNDTSNYDNWLSSHSKKSYDLYITDLDLLVDCKYRSYQNDTDPSIREHVLSRPVDIILTNDTSNFSYRHRRMIEKDGKKLMNQEEFFMHILKRLFSRPLSMIYSELVASIRYFFSSRYLGAVSTRLLRFLTSSGLVQRASFSNFKANLPRLPRCWSIEKANTKYIEKTIPYQFKKKRSLTSLLKTVLRTQINITSRTTELKVEHKKQYYFKAHFWSHYASDLGF